MTQDSTVTKAEVLAELSGKLSAVLDAPADLVPSKDFFMRCFVLHVGSSPDRQAELKWVAEAARRVRVPKMSAVPPGKRLELLRLLVDRRAPVKYPMVLSA